MVKKSVKGGVKERSDIVSFFLEAAHLSLFYVVYMFFFQSPYVPAEPGEGGAGAGPRRPEAEGEPPRPQDQ